MSNHPLAEDYLRWLAPQIRDVNDGLSNPEHEFWGLLELMSNKEFSEKYIVPNDHNRIADGRALRLEFCYSQNIRSDALIDLGSVSFLEVLIALSRRLAFQRSGKNAPGWCWILMTNLKLHRYADPLTRGKARRAERILDQCIRREYAYDGTGGFFPLENPDVDQTEVEIWYQMARYLKERPRPVESYGY